MSPGCSYRPATKGYCVLKRLRDYFRHQNSDDNENSHIEERSSDYDEDLAQAISNACNRLQEDEWPFPLEGGDKWVYVNKEWLHGWYLGSELHMGAIYLIHNNQLVLKPNQWSAEATPIVQEHISEGLKRDIVKRLNTLSTIENDKEGNRIKLEALPEEKWGRQV